MRAVFAVVVRKEAASAFRFLDASGKQAREDNVFVVSFVEGLRDARLERWRGGETVESRPLSDLRSVEDVAAEAGKPASLKLTLRGERPRVVARADGAQRR